jgi:hypothetical protein
MILFISVGNVSLNSSMYKRLVVFGKTETSYNLSVNAVCVITCTQIILNGTDLHLNTDGLRRGTGRSTAVLFLPVRSPTPTKTDRLNYNSHNQWLSEIQTIDTVIKKLIVSQSISQPSSQSNNQSINQSTNQTINQPTNKSSN